MINIEPLEEARYHVQVDGGGKYLVDLAAYNHNGFCGCRDFEVRHQPLLEQAEENGILDVTSRCKHIRRLLFKLADKSNLVAPSPLQGG